MLMLDNHQEAADLVHLHCYHHRTTDLVHEAPGLRGLAHHAQQLSTGAVHAWVDLDDVEAQLLIYAVYALMLLFNKRTRAHCSIIGSFLSLPHYEVVQSEQADHHKKRSDVCNRQVTSGLG
eukprot:1144409-Pelagomonas_calceolata.AAC.19